MQYAIKTSPQYTTWGDMLDCWRAADAIDLYESAWNFDHFYPINVPDTSGPCMEGWVTLTALAQATTRIRIGCMVTGVVYRHPALLANMASTLDIVSNGRLELGVGAGWNQEECDAYGIYLGSIKERMDRFDEALACLVGLLTQETTNFAGKYFTLTNARNNPAGVQKPHPPICIGGNGPKRTLAAAARWAQHWNYAAMDPAGFASTRALLHEHCDRIGRNPAEIRTSVHVVYNPKDGFGAWVDKAREFEAVGCDLAIAYLPSPHSAGVVEGLAEAVRGN